MKIRTFDYVANEIEKALEKVDICEEDLYAIIFDDFKEFLSCEYDMDDLSEYLVEKCGFEYWEDKKEELWEIINA